MTKISPFERFTDQYEAWFDKHLMVYEAELRAIKEMIPSGKSGLEIGTGSGRFAAPLGIRYGVEPSGRMREIAQKRGIQAIDGTAERLPFDDSRFDFVLMVTTICFVEDIGMSMQEARRVLSYGGLLIIGFIDRESKMGRIYLSRQNENVFYKDANFFSVLEIIEHMRGAGFTDIKFNQTVFGRLEETAEDEPVKPGYGEGSFVVICGIKNKGD